MNLKKIALAAILSCSLNLIAQEVKTYDYKVISIQTNFDVSKVYNKETGKKVGKEEFARLVKSNPNLPLEKVYNNKGKVVKYYYNPKFKNTTFSKPNVNSEVEVGALFPDLKLRTISGEHINFKKLKGKLIVLRFELEAESFRFKKEEVHLLDKKIKTSDKKDEIVPIIIFGCLAQEIERGFDYGKTDFKVIANGMDLQMKLKVRTFPSMMIIDKTGKLVGIYFDVDEIDFSKLD